MNKKLKKELKFINENLNTIASNQAIIYAILEELMDKKRAKEQPPHPEDHGDKPG